MTSLPHKRKAEAALQRQSGPASKRAGRSNPSCPRNKPKPDRAVWSTPDGCLDGCVIYVCKECCQSKGHVKRRRSRIQESGGRAPSQLSPEVTHILVPDSGTVPSYVEEFVGKLQPSQQLPRPIIVRASWLAQSLLKKKTIDTQPYEVKPSSLHTAAAASSPKAKDLNGISSFRKTRLERPAAPPSPRRLSPLRAISPTTDSDTEDEDHGLRTSISSCTGYEKHASKCSDANEPSRPVSDIYSSSVQRLDSTSSPASTSLQRTLSTAEPAFARQTSSMSSTALQAELPPYMCYNCGSPFHDARSCVLPLRDTTDDNRFMPFGTRFHVRVPQSSQAGDHDASAPTSGDAVPSQDDTTWVCARAHPTEKRAGPNDDIIEQLERLGEYYRQFEGKGKSEYAFKSMQLRKAITSLKALPTRISSVQHAMQLPHVARKTAEKIWEIASTGKLARLENLQSEAQDARSLFMDIHGIGATAAEALVAKGHRTVEDLRRHHHELTDVQRIGLRYFEHLQQRIPRAEIEDMLKFVQDTATSLVPGSVVQACGSYRRGKKSCGDADFLVSHPDGQSHTLLFQPLIARLKQCGMLAENLTTAERGSGGRQEKYMGIGKLPSKDIFRRIDIIVVPWDEWPCALLYFTGSGHFNRSMRLLAQKHGWSLNQHHVAINVVRSIQNRTVKVSDGVPVDVRTEHDVFALLGIPYRPPSDRNA